MLFGVGVSYRIHYSIVSYLYVGCSGSFISVGEERAYLSCYRLLVIMWFLLFLLVLGLGCLILLWHSQGIPSNYFVIVITKSPHYPVPTGFAVKEVLIRQ